jgi:hypothetical protein
MTEETGETTTVEAVDEAMQMLEYDGSSGVEFVALQLEELIRQLRTLDKTHGTDQSSRAYLERDRDYYRSRCVSFALYVARLLGRGTSLNDFSLQRPALDDPDRAMWEDDLILRVSNHIHERFK